MSYNVEGGELAQGEAEEYIVIPLDKIKAE